MNTYLHVISLEKYLFHGYIKKIHVNGYEGVLNIYPGHSPLLTMVRPSVLRIFTEFEEKKLYVSNGILEVQPNVIYILPDESCFLNELNYNQLIKKRNDIKNRIVHMKHGNQHILQDQLVNLKIKLKIIKKYLILHK
ncbi:ATP synthase F1 subunit epsilon [Buchnera aphidicola]|uniref:ATP synthase epsilon chain n=1 Tax=Buchnera aphidicola (Sarucallis kahawaluokalani) TaxID=1241878 RepID=A0A4D6YHL2_9GAMM|nr:ATP synthase F1 subunit epsilon [Buchnera aphidicola]QCI25821.1 ATP synthase F1 subunit epsilon [Buchnera aphidicola (Sarucallis kahawaluokalani)]